MVAALALLVVGLQTPIPAPAQTAPLTDPESIFEHTRDTWANQPYPRVAHYTIVVRVVDGGQPKTNHYAAKYDTRSRQLNVSAFSAEETANPFVPHGINVALRLQLSMGGSEGLTRRIGRDPPPTDYLGVPVLDPFYSFGLMRPVRASSPAASSSAAPGLKVIGSVGVSHRDYDVSLIDSEPYGETPAYHVSLRPRHDPKRFRLREMWVDARTYATLKIRTAGNFVDGPALNVGWMITFTRVDGVYYIEREAALETLEFGPRRRYQQATIEFDTADMGPTSTLSDIFFPRPQQEFELREPPR